MKNNRKIRQLLLTGIFFLSLIVLSACQSAKQPLHYGGQLYAQEFLLQGLDVWSPHNPKIEHVLFSQPDDLVQGFLSGVVDIALFSDIQAAHIFDELGDKALIIAIAESGDRISTIVRADSEIGNWEDLSGKKIALRSGSSAELVLKRYFSLNKLNWDTVEWVNLPVDNMPSALAESAVDAITALEPIPAMAQASGGMRVMQSYGNCCPAPMVLVTRRDFANKNAGLLTSFLQGHLDKISLIQSDSALAARTASKEAQKYKMDIPASAFHIVFKRIDYSIQIDNELISALEDTARAMQTAGILEKLPEFHFDNSFIEAAITKEQLR